MKDTKQNNLRKRNILGKLNSRICLIALIGGLLLILDQLLKKYFLNHSYSTNYFSLHLVKNTGSSFGLFPNKVILMIIISILFLGLLIWFRKEFKDCNLCYMFLIVGTLGNLIDRVFRGFVIDFFDLGWFPVFNLSDTIITLGVIGIVFALILDVEKDVIKKDEKIKK